MTERLYETDSYLAETEARATAITPDGGIVCDRSVFYAQGGGQPGDAGRLFWDGAPDGIAIVDAIKGAGDDVILVPEDGAATPESGATVRQMLDWDRRFRHMRIHTALHLLSVAIPLPVTGGSIGAEKGRLDFDMPEAPEDKDALEAKLNEIAEADAQVSYEWISDEELAANPALVKTMSVAPPKGSGRVRLVRIADGERVVDLQPCGGTHVARTGEIGRLRLGKIEKKGRRNRRVNLFLAE